MIRRKRPDSDRPPLPPDRSLPRAACVGLAVFGSVTTPTDIAACRAICAGCAERRACLHLAVHTHPSLDQGIWGGTTARQRIRLRGRLGIRFPALAPGQLGYGHHHGGSGCEGGPPIGAGPPPDIGPASGCPQ